MARLDARGLSEDRADIIDCLEAIESGALAGAAARAERESEGR